MVVVRLSHLVRSMCRFSGDQVVHRVGMITLTQPAICGWQTTVEVRPRTDGPDYPHDVDEAVRAAIGFAATHNGRHSAGHFSVEVVREFDIQHRLTEGEAEEMSDFLAYGDVVALCMAWDEAWDRARGTSAEWPGFWAIPASPS